MNSFKLNRLPLIGLVALFVSVILVAGGNLDDDLALLASKGDNEPPFDQDDVGYNNHKDIFYYEDQKVDAEMARKNYLVTKLTLAGMAKDITNRPVAPASYPFVVAQRSFKNLGTNMDRWDVKDVQNAAHFGLSSKAQYLALYHGRKSTFVVNKVRAQLLRNIANAIDDQLPVLDRLAKKDAREDPRLEQTVDSIRGSIERVFREVGTMVANTMKESDEATASATVVIVTKKFVISARVGEGKVIAYTDSFETVIVNARGEDDTEPESVFGANKGGVKNLLHPHIEFASRKQEGHQFLIIQSPSINQCTKKFTETFSDSEITRIAAMKYDTYRNNDFFTEQDIYMHAAEDIMDKLTKNLNWADKLMHSDYALIMVGLNTDYENFH